MTLYASKEEVRQRVDATYVAYPLLTDDDLLDAAILKASELIDEYCLARAQQGYDNEEEVDAEDRIYRPALTKAVADQIEFWAEVGTEHDVAGLRGSVVAGRLQAHPTAATLGPRTKRTLIQSGLYWAGVSIG